jgi:hypothetical protein
MARYKDDGANHLSGPTAWIHDLARGETHPDAESVLQSARGFDPQLVVEESSINFLMELRDYLTEYAQAFNSFSEGASRFQEVKIFSVAQTAADFMLFRSQVKLLFSNAAHGMIQISFAHHLRSAMSVDGQMHPQSSGASLTPALASSQELLAQIGPFRDVYWTYQGERVSAEQVARFYFSEFARVTRDQRKSRAGNQLLLDQIKALLNEKGLDF